MYNSLFVSFTMQIVNFVKKLYGNSLIRKINYKIKNFNTKVASGSKFLHFFDGGNNIFKNSVFAKFVYKFFKFLDFLFNKLKKFNQKLAKNSEVADTLGYVTADVVYGLKLIYEIFFFLGLGLFFMKLLGILDLSFKISFGFILLWFLGKLINPKELLIIQNSKFLNFFLDIFRLDKGGENWW